MTINDIVIRDARKPLLLTITAADIAQSIKNDPAHCAAAVACERLTHADEVRIHKSRAYVKIGKTWTRYLVPAAVYREIVSFDRGASFEPGAYRLTPPSPANRLGARQGGEDKGGPSTRAGRLARPKRAPAIHTRNVRADANTQIYDSLT